MVVYDMAHELANEIKNSKAYLEYKEMKDKVFLDSNLKSKIEEFEKIRYDVQLLTVKGKEEDTEKMQKLQEMYKILVTDQVVKDFFDKEVAFNVMLADVNKIIAEAVKDVLN